MPHFYAKHKKPNKGLKAGVRFSHAKKGDNPFGIV
jgi:hypothetical protein